MRLHRGFTLIELMIVLVVAGILLGIAVPAFSEQMRKSRRSDALRVLGEIVTKQENWRASHATYSDNGCAVAVPAACITLATSPHYTFDVTVATATRWVATATPTVGGAQVGDRCGTYTFDLDNVARPGQPVQKTAGLPGNTCF